MTLHRIDKDIPEPLPGNGNSEVNPFYKPERHPLDFFGLACDMTADEYLWKKQTPKKN
jgi:hypothetical protein